MSWLAENWSVLIGGSGLVGAGGLASRLVDRWLLHKRHTRRQTDDVAMQLVAQLQDRVRQLEEALRHVQHQLRNKTAESVGLFWLLKFCPDERRAEAVAAVEARWAVEAAEAAAPLGEVRNAMQAAVSELRMAATGG